MSSSSKLNLSDLIIISLFFFHEGLEGYDGPTIQKQVKSSSSMTAKLSPKCGRSEIPKGEIRQSQWAPWSILINGSDRKCSGLLVSPFWVLSIASCIGTDSK